jgi:hypothetical protein
MDDKGNIRDLSYEDDLKLRLQRREEAENRRRHSVTPITDREAAFFRSKGMAFCGLWGKRLARGLTGAQKEELDRMVDEFHGVGR